MIYLLLFLIQISVFSSHLQDLQDLSEILEKFFCEVIGEESEKDLKLSLTNATRYPQGDCFRG